MPERPSQARSRAEARRRARYRAQGRESDAPDDEEDEPSASSSGGAPGGFLSRIFPPAPPLPGKPDPLAGFTYRGPLPGLVSGFYILARWPRWWVLAGVLWVVGEILARIGPANAAIATLASVISFAALIGAGWFGWARPWAFGLGAAVLGVILFSAIVGTAILQSGVDPGVSGPALYLGLASQESFQLFFGALAGWYGGYLRRRLAAQPQRARSNRRRSSR